MMYPNPHPLHIHIPNILDILQKRIIVCFLVVLQTDMSIDTYIQQHADMNINMENGSQDRFVLIKSLATKDASELVVDG